MVCWKPGMRYKFIYTSHVLGPAHSWVHFILSKAPFLVFFLLFFLKPEVHFHVHSVSTQQCTLEENVTVNDHQIVFSLHPKQKHSMRFTFVLSKYMIGQYFKTLTSNVNMYCNTNREVTTCSCWTTAHFEKVVKRVKEHFQVFIFKFNIRFLQNQVTLWW